MNFCQPEMGGRLKLRMIVSPMVTVVAWILTNTSLSLGAGFSTSFSRSTSGSPYFSYTIAFTFSLLLGVLLDKSSHFELNLIAHVFRSWQSSVIFRTASPKVRKINSVILFWQTGQRSQMD